LDWDACGTSTHVLAGLLDIMGQSIAACHWLLERKIIGAIDDLPWIEEVQVCGYIFVCNFFELASYVVAFVETGTVESNGGLDGGRESDPDENDVLVEHCDGDGWMKELLECCVVGRVLSCKLMLLYVRDALSIVEGSTVVSPRSATKCYTSTTPMFDERTYNP
jgi:hypothetical protein